MWDADTGFGGDGNRTDLKSVAYGHCVTDGPFAKLTARYFGTENITHCLSRGFNPNLQQASGVRPEALEELMQTTTSFASYNLKLEYGAHNTIPMYIRGDFYRVTAPFGM